MIKEIKNKLLLRAVEEILRKGTYIVSFKWRGYNANVLIGSKRAEYLATRVHKISAINKACYNTEWDGELKTILSGLDNNQERIVALFSLDKIKFFSYKPRLNGFVERFVWTWFC